LVKINSFIFADTLADAAFLFLEIKTAFIYIRDERDSLRIIDVDGLIFRYGLVELVRVLHRAVFHAGGTTPAFVLVDIAGLLDQCDLEITSLAFDATDFGVGQYLDVLLPVDLDQFW